MTAPKPNADELGALLDLALEQSRIEAAAHGMDSTARLYLGKACQLIAYAQSVTLGREYADHAARRGGVSAR